MFLAAWVLVPAPLIPEVALVEFPPPKAFLSKTSTLAPCSKAVWAADIPDNPAPTIITYFLEFISIFIELIIFLYL